MLPDVIPQLLVSIVKKSDWPVFLRWAQQEGWRIPFQELKIYQGPLADSAYVARSERQPVGFVTLARHERSGWIGNLLVDAAHRRQGIGTLLFEHAMQTLKERGARTIWLTASRQGQPLYNSYGFAEVDRIERWVHGGPFGKTAGSEAEGDADLLFAQDSRAWGESRFWLLAHLSQRGRVFSAGRTAALLQDGTSRHIIGPWLSESVCPRENRQVLGRILTAADRNAEIVVDVLASSPVKSLLAAAGFNRIGGTSLMAHGPRTGFAKQHLMALASLGSMG